MNWGELADCPEELISYQSVQDVKNGSCQKGCVYIVGHIDYQNADIILLFILFCDNPFETVLLYLQGLICG